MREIRSFELQYEEPAQTLRLARPLQLHVSEGELWLTIEGDSADYWLRAGESLTLAGGASVRIGAGRPGARFSMAFVALAALGGASASAFAARDRTRDVAGSLAGALRGWVLRGWAQRGASRTRAAG